ncbi:hypothetical protein [Propylenella binzhouense]|uniref:Uncharacterized protein n=1 Tax=Propylenella binzhouense TaxID=2555902 RepID=A0A964T3G0_9HYPH|nr:hypothetical protein [Propylenella binzhouense]MYZ47515.1 hypothetical protein [Propylenella binzhouense]
MTPNADVNDRGSIERLYPYAAFEADAGANSMAKAETRHGIRIETVPDASGAFRIARASHAPADFEEMKAHGFVCPYMGRAYGFFRLSGGMRGAVTEERDIFDPLRDEYEGFIDTIIGTARELARAPAPTREN